MSKKIFYPSLVLFVLFFASPWVCGEQAKPPEHQSANKQASTNNHKKNIPQQGIIVRPANETINVEIAKYTYWLMIFTGVLAVVSIIQGAILWGNIRLARKEFIASHRPKIVLRNISTIKEDGIEKILYSLINTGESKAIIVNSRILGEFIIRGEPIRNIRCVEYDDLGRIELIPGENRDFTCEIPTEARLYIMLGRDAIRMGKFKNADFYFAGSIRYADDMGNIRTSIFRRKFENGCFYRTGDPDHEYAD